MDIIIDGYNLIGSESGLAGALEHKRNWLIKQLVRYQEIKKFNLTVVFDGWRSGQAHEAAERAGGIAVVYSRLGEKADAVIVRIARTRSSGAVIITSDREIRSAVEKLGAATVSAAEFNQILRSLDGSYCGDDDDDELGLSHRKKGQCKPALEIRAPA